MNAVALLWWGAAAILVVCFCVLRINSAQIEMTQAEKTHQQVERDIKRLAQAQAAMSGMSEKRLSDSDLISRAQQALSQAGLPIQACSGVQPRPDSSASGSSIRTQTVLMMLRGLTPADLGGWFAAWRKNEHAWQVAEVQMTRSANSQGNAIAASDMNRYDISVVLAAHYLAEAP